jgi:hypothetical protein
MGAEEDSLGTVEKVTVANPEAGAYAVHVRANPSFTSESVEYAIVVNGPFVHDDLTTNPTILARTVGAAQPANCDALHTGRFCRASVVDLERGTAYRTTIGPREFRYFRIVGPDVAGHVLTLASRPQEGKSGLVRLVVNIDNKVKLSQPRFLAGVHQGHDDIKINLDEYDGGIPDTLYVAAFADFREVIEYEILWMGDPEETAEKGMTALVIAVTVIAAVVGVAAIGIIAYKFWSWHQARRKVYGS